MTPPEYDEYVKAAQGKSARTLREENARMAHALNWILTQRHTPRAYRHMKFEKLIDAAKYGLAESEAL